jgi:hypothetical protein
MKMKYTLIAEDEFDGSKTTREFTVDYLPDVLSEVELFLRGAGFFFDGNLEFVVEQSFADDHQLDEDWDEVPLEHDKSYFDTERNK